MPKSEYRMSLRSISKLVLQEALLNNYQTFYKHLLRIKSILLIDLAHSKAYSTNLNTIRPQEIRFSFITAYMPIVILKMRLNSEI